MVYAVGVLAEKLMEATLDPRAASGRTIAVDHPQPIVTLLVDQRVVCGYEGDQRLLDGAAV
jgi:hypothetical protein